MDFYFMGLDSYISLKVRRADMENKGLLAVGSEGTSRVGLT
jgi:hypothetical protein